jgi:hypothetical protein
MGAIGCRRFTGGDHPVVNAMAQMHQNRMLAQGIQPQYPDLGRARITQDAAARSHSQGKVDAQVTINLSSDSDLIRS